MNKVLVCPAWNEEGAVGDVVRSAVANGYRIVVVDDGSLDATAAIARRCGAIVVQHPMNLGVGAAIQTGFRVALRAGADAVVQVDADGQHPVEQAQYLFDALSDSVHMAIGSRFAENEALRPKGMRGVAMRRLASHASNVAGVRITDASSGFRAISRPLLLQFARRFPSSYLGDTFGALLLASRLGFGVIQVPVEMRERQAGEPSTGAGRSALLVVRAIASSVTDETRGGRGWQKK
ncbi:MAG: glycosyltransferase family 2 protein [Actinomycetota bacterium]|nr:glycosyltransferase family 2 protein [Actinomycetota bacterium]